MHVRIHAASAIAGAATIAVLLLAIGAGQVPNTTTSAFLVTGAQELLHPSNFVQIYEGETYTVPPGSRFILSALGMTDYSTPEIASLRVRKSGTVSFVTELEDRFDGPGEVLGSASATRGDYVGSITAGPGDAIEVFTSVSPTGGRAVAWGYLERPIAAKIYIQIDEGEDYTVPSGKWFVLTAVGTNLGGVTQRIEFYRDSVLEFDVRAPVKIQRAPVGMSAPSGSTLSVRKGDENSPDDARAWGYLVDG